MALEKFNEVLISRDILTIENAKGLLQGLDLFLAACNTVLVALTCINARWLKLLVVCKRSIQFLLSSVKVCLGLLEGLLMVLLLSGLVLDVLGLLRLSTDESPMNSSYCFWASASAALVSDSRRAKSDWITSIMPTTPPFSDCMPL